MFIALLFLMTLTGCSDDMKIGDVETAVMPADYGEVFDTAKSEFNTIFADFSRLNITETATMARKDDSSDIVIQFSYTSENGDGVYGFEFVKDESGNYTILQQGEDITIDNLVGE